MQQQPQSLWAPTDIDVTRPNVARMYDVFLGGAHNFAADREMAAQVTAGWPETPRVARANRAFLRRAVGYLLDCGVRQFLDVGSGIPTAGNVHEIAQSRDPDARVVYVDIDPIAVAHSRAMLAGNPLTVTVQADLCEPDRILDDAAVTKLIDLSEPVAVLAVSVLHFISDDLDPQSAIGVLRDATGAGSYLAVSHVGFPRSEQQTAEQIAEMYRSRTTASGGPRPRDEVLAFFDGYDLVEPGLVDLPQWRPDPQGNGGDSYDKTVVYAGVGRRR